MNNVVEEIFQYLDAESLQNVELTCKAWRAAASKVNQEKLWQVWLHNKVCFTLTIHFVTPHSPALPKNF
jgi:hypothetical protein